MSEKEELLNAFYKEGFDRLERENQELRALVEAKDKVIEAAQELSRLLDDTHPLVIALKALDDLEGK